MSIGLLRSEENSARLPKLFYAEQFRASGRDLAMAGGSGLFEGLEVAGNYRFLCLGAANGNLASRLCWIGTRLLARVPQDEAMIRSSGQEILNP